MSYFIKTIRRLINAMGLDVTHFDVENSAPLRLVKALEWYDIDMIFDVGANVGQFASGLRRCGYRGGMVSFEALSSAHTKLSRVAKYDSAWYVHAQTAIGDYDGEVDINISGNSVSSSVLPMSAWHAVAASNSAYVGRERVAIAKLDSVAPAYLSQSRRSFLKIDTQGFEWQVIDGARETIPSLQGISCEMSLVELYKGQHLLRDVKHRIESAGFSLWSINNGFTDPRNGRTLQIDATFFKFRT
jgi:FkbM family methyltransferase